ncbi:cell envelope integrity EipB family protein [Aquibium sp. A9E412]|uniref:cell envelope integrity EipB family protein n=1 Tax=Aquibium sp. A9E412 TaxID=2976767 RepID=UPI0025AF8B08|nr:cell envelope integrity EipB family protein [Aquibium sp. A9E412]MDN2564711.1 cell envelope integrity EipB family protein [Aquibium sp. A9E412]
MRSWRPLILTATGLLAAVPGVAVAGGLVPHRAVYDLELERASDRSGIGAISGRLAYEFSGSRCAGYTVTFRHVAEIQTDEIARITDQQTTTFESGEGDLLRFATRSFVDQSLEFESRGTARATPEGTEVSLEKPEAGTFTLPPARFPTAHLLELMEKAAAGTTFYEAPIYDGSGDADEVMTTTVVIGKPETLAADAPEHAVLGELADEPFRPVTIAYFDAASTGGEQTPSYHIGFKLYDNGVSADLTMDYGEYAIAGRLVDLATFEPDAECAPD